jgi:PRTRC genetic system protein F
VASYIYWCGEENEVVALDMECGDDAEARAAMRDDMVTRQKLDQAFPPWATSTPRKRLSVAAFERLTNGLHDPVIRDIAADALTLARLRIEDEFRPNVDGEDGEYLGWGAVLSWREDDLTVRVYDDLVQMAHQGEFYDRMGELEIALDAPQTMRAWQRSMHVRFKAIHLIDRLIHRLSAGH